MLALSDRYEGERMRYGFVFPAPTRAETPGDGPERADEVARPLAEAGARIGGSFVVAVLQDRGTRMGS